MNSVPTSIGLLEETLKNSNNIKKWNEMINSQLEFSAFERRRATLFIMKVSMVASVKLCDRCRLDRSQIALVPAIQVHQPLLHSADL